MAAENLLDSCKKLTSNWRDDKPEHFIKYQLTEIGGIVNAGVDLDIVDKDVSLSDFNVRFF